MKIDTKNLIKIRILQKILPYMKVQIYLINFSQRPFSVYRTVPYYIIRMIALPLQQHFLNLKIKKVLLIGQILINLLDLSKPQVLQSTLYCGDATKKHDLVKLSVGWPSSSSEIFKKYLIIPTFERFTAHIRPTNKLY